ncbi:MAG: cytochrome c oxidase subunit 3 [Flavobacteriales bacterium]|nr:cytochrome c oxidase subunit 3 [Flavobacteriales bacterium]
MAGEASKSIPKDVLWGGGRSPFSVSYGKMMMWFFLVSDALTFSGLLIAYGVIRHSSEFAWPIGEQVFQALPGLEGSYPLAYVALMTFILIISSVTMVLAVEAGHRNNKKDVTKWMLLTVIGGFFFVGSQAWEWSHFIHGGGGAFKLSETVNVTGTLMSDETTTMDFSITDDDRVFMDHHFGTLYEEYLAGERGIKLTETPTSVTISGHGHEYNLEYLTLNKYVENSATVTGADMMALWNAKTENGVVFGANMQENEYGVQQQYANYFFFITGFHGFHVFSGVVINLIIFLMVLRGVFERTGHYEMVEKVGLYWHFVDLVWVFVFTFFYLV